MVKRRRGERNGERKIRKRERGIEQGQGFLESLNVDDE